MARLRFIRRLKPFWRTGKQRRNAGFTLIELLVSLVIGAIITMSLLSLVVDLTDVNQKDTARSETQRDMQLAMNYITQDLREAVFVYDGECLQGAGTMDATNFDTSCPGIVNYIPPVLTSATASERYVPVLAFWKSDFLPDTVQATCRAAAGNQTNLTNLVNSGVPCLSGKSYTLVVYALVDSLTPNNTWQGRARIVRYQLPQFNAAGASNNLAGGWLDPLPDTTANFQQWPFRRSPTVAVPAGFTRANNTADIATLVDFVDDTPIPTSGATQATCAYPSIASPFPPSFDGFFVCVRGKTRQAALNPTTQSAEIGVNQEVQVVLTGNVSGRSGFPLTTSNTARLAPMQTRVLVRGSVNKNPG